MNDKLEVYQKLVALNDKWNAEQIAVIHNTIAKGTTANELAYFLMVCRSVNLNPMMREIWCYKDHKGNLIVFAGRDGFLAYAQSNPNFAGIRSSSVRENDTFAISPADGKVAHSHNGQERGNIIGAYAIVFRQGGASTVEYADFATYNRGSATWKTHPDAMICKVAETMALKKAFGMSSVQAEHDFSIDPRTNTAIARRGVDYKADATITMIDEN